MSITSISTYTTSPSTLIQGGATNQATSVSDPAGESAGSSRPHGHHGHRGGGKMENALMQALQSMGLDTSKANAATSSGASSSTGTGTGADGNNDGSSGSSDSTSKVKHDMSAFMHSMFEAMRSEDANSSSGDANGASTANGGGKPDFAGDLGKLISQVSSGTAPAALQSAFDQLKSDLQPAATGSTATTPAATGASTDTSQGTLLNLLEQVQKNVGYGIGTSSTASVGNIVSQSA
ncbi:MAG: hypothetical protein ABIZ09_15235 [Rhodoferax sp.]